MSRSRYANVSSRTLKVSDNDHVSTETRRNFDFETAIRSLIRNQQQYVLVVFKVKTVHDFVLRKKNWPHFVTLLGPAELQAFAFFFVSNTYRNQSVSTIKQRHLILGGVIPKTQKKGRPIQNHPA